MIYVKVKVDLSGLDDFMESFEPGGEVQKFIDEEFIKHCDPYVPRDVGVLAESPYLSTDIGSGEIVYDTPYAAKLYDSPELNFQGKDNVPARGAYWAERMWADRGDEIIRGAKEKAGGRNR